jgi:hypothetical protein
VLEGACSAAGQFDSACNSIDANTGSHVWAGARSVAGPFLVRGRNRRNVVATLSMQVLTAAIEQTAQTTVSWRGYDYV